MALTFNLQFEVDLRKRIGEMREAKRDQLSVGGGVSDYAEYREQVGYLRALSDIEEACGEVQADLSKKR